MSQTWTCWRAAFRQQCAVAGAPVTVDYDWHTDVRDVARRCRHLSPPDVYISTSNSNMQHKYYYPNWCQFLCQCSAESYISAESCYVTVTDEGNQEICYYAHYTMNFKTFNFTNRPPSTTNFLVNKCYIVANCFHSRQQHNSLSLHCKTADTRLMHRMVWLFTLQLPLVLILATPEGWPGWVKLH